MPPAIDSRLLHVGGRVRAQRERAGYSLSGLAAAAGIGKATLSELEQGRRNPTLETLYSLAGVLGVPLSGFVAEDGRQGVPIGGGTVDARLLEANHQPNGSLVEVYWLAIGPGERRSPGHGAGVLERLVLVGGRARVGPVGREVEIEAGGVASWDSSGQHVYASAAGAAGVLTIINPAPTDSVGT
ncbi:helix-turn-helix domain-containing protein [Arthrobacter sp.]|uniref:helix-turn-helix domain-containing protein n=1 Tax=Arthrobacter sp. TaxID=1667 RepID=UPI003A8F46B5